MEQFLEELQIISSHYPDTFKFLLVTTYILGFFCPLVDGIALKTGFSVQDLILKRSKRASSERE